jgi:hypothetical protein
MMELIAIAAITAQIGCFVFSTGIPHPGEGIKLYKVASLLVWYCVTKKLELLHTGLTFTMKADLFQLLVCCLLMNRR